MLTFGEKEDYVSGYVSFNFEHPVPLAGSRQAPCSRSYGRVGSAVSVFGLGRFGSALAVLDCMSLGSCLSLRSLQRLSSSISVLGLARFGSSLSVRRWLECILQHSSLPTRGIPSLFNVLRDFELEVGLKQTISIN